MEAQLALKYQNALGLAIPGVPDAAMLAHLWLERFFVQPLRLTDGRSVTVLQSGLPARPGALRMTDAALRFGDGDAIIGDVAIGGDTGGLLSVVWEADPARPGTAAQATVTLRNQLVAPWPELAGLIDLPVTAGAAASCPLSAETVRAAGIYRLQRKARRLDLRIRAVGRVQLIWEAIAEALGYHRNQLPFRHLARRLPAAFLAPLDAADRAAILFGVAGFLPAGDLAALPPEAQAAAKPLWARWWKARATLGYAVLPAAAWDRARLRPANRPERRLAALAQLPPHLERIERALDRRDAAAFARILSECHEPFWNSRASWKGHPFPKPLQLIGAERIQDLTLNLFWPLIALDDLPAALAALETLRPPANTLLREAAERFGTPVSNALIQQGLLQADRDAR